MIGLSILCYQIMERPSLINYVWLGFNQHMTKYGHGGQQSKTQEIYIPIPSNHVYV